MPFEEAKQDLFSLGQSETSQKIFFSNTKFWF
jgi:hypothetical protein